MYSCCIFVCKTREKGGIKTGADIEFWGRSDTGMLRFFLLLFVKLVLLQHQVSQRLFIHFNKGSNEEKVF